MKEKLKGESNNKAIELIEKFLPNVYCYSGSGMLTNTYSDKVAISNAKIQALILTEEVLKTVDATHKYLFYKDVKNTLETKDFYLDDIENKIIIKFSAEELKNKETHEQI